ncbi:F0F1 ATP synthase subunit B [Desulfofundulus thermobenzoicus]|uniref:ATP synthase subunit b n=1 Tax=Desulfofundulus thermobenzoicus TaxID=29376 RepID=A0A6N7ITU7_9FIRM|nr:F0F1 ATP synthase subunit B [Desulfofundulus thermobenzoicus]HHW43871.1 F0F1 ATP synthase subunit B [Desulfotomaculum sp.]
MEALGINYTLLAQIINFIVLLIFLRLVVYKPLVNLLEQRQQYIASNVSAAEEERRQAEALRQQYTAEMQKAREEAQAIIQNATKAGEEKAQQILDAAKAEAQRIKESALEEIAREKEKAVAELRNQVADLSVLVAGKIINQTITPEIQHNLIKEFIDEAGGLPC